MSKIILKSFIGSMFLLFFASNLEAQYAVFRIKGTVEMSADGTTWNSLKKKDELKESYKIKMLENSLLEIVDSKNLIYSYAESKTVSVGDIVKQQKTIWEAMDENSGMRKAFGGVVRSNGTEVYEAPTDVYAIFNDSETLCQYDSLSAIPEGVVFFISICNTTDEDITVNVYQDLGDKELTPCFPSDISIEKNTVAEIPDVLFGKEENTGKFIICQKK